MGAQVIRSVTLLLILALSTPAAMASMLAAAKNKVASAVDAAGDAAKEQAMKKIEDNLAAKAPPAAKMWFPCCGGPVPTLEMCECTIPVDQRDEFQTGIKNYKELQSKDVNWGKAVQ